MAHCLCCSLQWPHCLCCSLRSQPAHLFALSAGTANTLPRNTIAQSPEEVSAQYQLPLDARAEGGAAPPVDLSHSSAHPAARTDRASEAVGTVIQPLPRVATSAPSQPVMKWGNFTSDWEALFCCAAEGNVLDFHNVESKGAARCMRHAPISPGT